MSYNTVILLLGSNIKNPKENIRVALTKIEKNIGRILKKSDLIVTKPVEFDSVHFFCNIAVKIETQLSPIQLLLSLKRIEKEMGRLNDSAYYGVYKDRVIDIDIILYNSLKFVSDNLLIPHYKNLYQRDFAKEIINEVR